ncbi:L-histidine N(alpha)-methyltransferase [Algoriphagus pacificus]|uniref:L-histidine N(Alpha)-methyltransferase n=1 Tax=Algoriphagus pacificus TaxID=2811234 RepID=A0ABS3CLU6_9BACT|nr:L-histidine N(alpha)-methyltransferase [Algoriphagus pacificus]MBN7816609.1 L-histidine N(alpha)-methyltransferase [Algoriphagus pacificus]
MTSKNLDFGTFAQDVMIGLSANPKTLPSKYFYDAKGDKLFQKIMALPEYYLTRKEFEIFENQYEAILEPILNLGQSFNLVELGAGDGLKTKILLKYLNQQDADFEYFPVDFSGSVLQELKESLATGFPKLKVTSVEDTYRGALKKRAWENGKPNLILFLGSNLGNFSREEAYDILDHLRIGANHNDFVLIGIDLKKNPQIILDAYHDPAGVTRDFNLNLLDRINRELNGDIDLDSFIHWPSYDPVSGECRSHLVSLKDQTINLKALDQSFYFEAFEPIFTEISKKYSLSEIEIFAERGGFVTIENFTDSEQYFADVLWQRK